MLSAPEGDAPAASMSHLDSQFLPAWTDRVAGVNAFSASLLTENLYGDGHRLIVADEDGKLKVHLQDAHGEYQARLCER
jgi:hypothetical protein